MTSAVTWYLCVSRPRYTQRSLAKPTCWFAAQTESYSLRQTEDKVTVITEGQEGFYCKRCVSTLFLFFPLIFSFCFLSNSEKWHNFHNWSSKKPQTNIQNNTEQKLLPSQTSKLTNKVCFFLMKLRDKRYFSVNHLWVTQTDKSRFRLCKCLQLKQLQMVLDDKSRRRFSAAAARCRHLMDTEGTLRPGLLCFWLNWWHWRIPKVSHVRETGLTV